MVCERNQRQVRVASYYICQVAMRLRSTLDRLRHVASNVTFERVVLRIMAAFPSMAMGVTPNEFRCLLCDRARARGAEMKELH